jgi:putative transposase
LDRPDNGRDPAGLVGAVEAVLIGAAWQRCRVHFMRNVLAKVPKASGEMVAAAIRTIFSQPDATHVHAQFDEIVVMLEAKFPHVAVMLSDARADLLGFSSFPVVHWKKIWSTNPLERLNKEIKRRTNVVGIFPNDASVSRLATAVIAEQHDEWAVIDRRYLSEGSMNRLYDADAPPALPETLTPTKITS